MLNKSPFSPVYISTVLYVFTLYSLKIKYDGFFLFSDKIQIVSNPLFVYKCAIVILISLLSLP